MPHDFAPFVAAPLRLWRHPNGKPLCLTVAACLCVWSDWLFVGLLLLDIAFVWWTLFGEH